MPPSWIFFFVLGSSLPVTQFSQQGRQDNLCWVPLSLFKRSRDGSNPCGSGMPRQTWSTVCCVEVWDGMTLAMWHMLDAACCSCTQFLKAAKPSEAWPSQHVESCAGWAGQCVLPPLPPRAPSLLLGTHLQHRGAAGAPRAASVHREK